MVVTKIRSHDDLRLAIEALVDYSWSDEERDFQEHFQDDGGTHIFRALVALDNWLNGTEANPEDYVSSPHEANA